MLHSSVNSIITILFRYYQPPASNGKRINSTLSILPEDMKKFFLSRFFICYEYNELSQSTEEEMFQLVQRGIALTPAEKMRAMSSEWATLARKYEDDYSLILNRKSPQTSSPAMLKY